MKIRILGCGGAGGVPMVSHGWGACDPSNPKNRRRRTSILLTYQKLQVLVDTSPDMREQFLDCGVRHLDAVLYTHAHADHIHGIDELRELNRAMGASIDVYAQPHVLQELKRRFGYVFAPLEFDNYPFYKPWIISHEINEPFQINGLEVIPIEQDHGFGPSLGYRFGNVAYSTDAVNLSEEAFEALAGISVWIVGCFTNKEHRTHAHTDKVLAWVERVKPKRTILTHMGPGLDYDSLRASLPTGIEPAFDGMEIEINDDEINDN